MIFDYDAIYCSEEDVPKQLEIAKWQDRKSHLKDLEVEMESLYEKFSSCLPNVPEFQKTPYENSIYQLIDEKIKELEEGE